MSEFRFILGRRALIVFLALLVATGALLGVPAVTRTLAESPPPSSQEAAAVSVDSAAAEGLFLDPSGHSPLLQAGSGSVWTLVPTTSQSPSAPSARHSHAMATTPSGVLLFGGDSNSDKLGDTWLYSQTTPPPPAAMPSMSPWALALLSLALLGAGGWWFSRRRRLV